MNSTTSFKENGCRRPGSIKVKAAALGARARVSSAGMQCAWTGMCLPVPSPAVQLTFLMNNLVFNVCSWREHFENGVDWSVRAIESPFEWMKNLV